MRCNRCNAEVNSNEKFCFKCGNKIEKEVIDNINTINLKKENDNNINIKNDSSNKKAEDTTFNHLGEEISKNSKKIVTFLKDIGGKFANKIKLLTKVQKILIATISLLFIAGVTIVSIPQTKEKVINQFEEAIVTNQPAKLKKIIISEDKRLKISEENLDAIIKYYNDNPSNLNSDILYLINMYPGEYNQDTQNPFAIITKKVMFKEKYYIKLNPRYIEVDSPYKDVKIDLYCGEKLLVENIENVEIGPFVPGKYKFVISCDNEFAKSESSKEVDIFYGELKNYVDLSGTINNNIINSDEQDAIIYINNKSTGKKANELSSISGLKNGDTVYGIFKSNNKEIKSNVVQISGSSEIYLSYEYTKPPTIDEVKDNVSELIYDYLYYFADAISYNDFSYIEEYISVDSDLYNLQKTNVPKFYEKGISETYINHEIIDISYDEEQCTGSITVKEVYDITTRDEETDEYNSVEKIFNNKYEFVFNEIDGTYKLTNLVEN